MRRCDRQVWGRRFGAAVTHEPWSRNGHELSGTGRYGLRWPNTSNPYTMVRRGILWDGPIQAKTGTVQFLNRVPGFESRQGHSPVQPMVQASVGAVQSFPNRDNCLDLAF